jgi:hypothetical protein
MISMRLIPRVINSGQINSGRGMTPQPMSERQIGTLSDAQEWCMESSKATPIARPELIK